MYLLAIDPGKRSGFAWFEHGLLKRAGSFDGDRIVAPPTANGTSALVNVAVVIELPQTRAGSGTVPPNDLIKLAYRAGHIGGICSAWGCLQPVHTVLPSVWKGNLPKEVVWNRAASSLTGVEVPAWQSLKTGDGRDAVALGLWTLKRLRS